MSNGLQNQFYDVCIALALSILDIIINRLLYH